MVVGRGCSANVQIRSTAGISQEVLHLVKAQRRVRGTVAVVEQGNCVIESVYGRFPFDPRSVKANKNHPDRKPQVGDPCEFRLSHHIPPTAVSIRVAVPKMKRSSADEDFPLDAKYEKLVAEYLEVQCGHVAPLMSKLEGTELTQPVAMLQLVAKAQDEIENARGLGDARAQLLQEFPAALTGAVPEELATIPFFKQFRLVVAGVRGLAEPYKTIVTNFAATRGEKLAEFVGKEITTLVDFTDYNVAVGGTLYEAVAEMVAAQVGRSVPVKAAADMGIFVEKTKALKGFLEHTDTVRGSNWPKDVWGHHFDIFGQVAAPSSRTQALDRLNLIITDTFSHSARGIEFLSHIADAGSVFCFLAIPCVMALAELEKLWGNAKVFTEQVGVSQKVAGSILGMEHPRDAVAWMGSVTEEMHESFRSENYDPVSYKMLNQIQGVRTALRRVDAAVAAYSKVNAGEGRSLTRALLAEQGAALGGRLLYNMIDSLGSVFQAEAHSPYSFGGDSLAPSVSDDASEISANPTSSGGAMGFLSGIARGWLGLDAPSQPLPAASASENFASFYDGNFVDDSASSASSSAASPSVSSGDDLSRKRSLSLRGCQQLAEACGTTRSRTP